MAEAEHDDAEFNAMQSVYGALRVLDDSAQQRVLDYVSNRLGLTQQARPVANGRANGREEVTEEEREEEAASNTQHSRSYSSFAELYDAAQPKSQSDRALVAGYWLQHSQGGQNFDSFSVNKELKNLGEGVPNITSALDALKAQKPALVLQLKKSGKSRQARKTYKVTVAGLKFVENMIGG